MTLLTDAYLGGRHVITTEKGKRSEIRKSCVHFRRTVKNKTMSCLPPVKSCANNRTVLVQAKNSDI